MQAAAAGHVVISTGLVVDNMQGTMGGRDRGLSCKWHDAADGGAVVRQQGFYVIATHAAFTNHAEVG